MEAANQSSEFKIVTGEKENTIIVLLIGQIRIQEVKELEGLLTLLLERPQSSIIFSFRDIKQFLPGAHRAFVQIQTSLRKAGKILSMASLKPDVKASLLQGGVLRDSEVFKNIPEAWLALKARLQDLEALPIKKTV